MSVRIQEQDLRNLFASCADVQLQTHRFGIEPHEEKVLFLFCTGLVDSMQVNLLIPTLEQSNRLPLIPVLLEENQNVVLQQIVQKVFAGELLLYFGQTEELFSLNFSKVPQRQPEESVYEVSVKGPRDSFTESLETNVALLRKRVRSTTLCNESFVIGKRSQTKVSLLYLSDVINTEVLEEARARLNSVDVDIVNGVSPLEELLADSPFSLVPLISFITRPDYVVESLQRGRFSILIDGAPAALVAPVNILYLIKSSEDTYMTFYYVTIERLLRYIGLLIAALLPGFYVSLVSYHLDHLPFHLLATFTLNSYGIPIPPTAQVILMLILFELLAEAGMRLPKAVGPTVTVVGGLIVGDTLIRSGLMPANVVVIVAITLMSQFVLVNQAFGSSVIFMRVIVLISSSVLGFVGFVVANFLILLYLTTLKSFGMPFMADWVDPKKLDLLKSYLMLPKPFLRRAPKFLKTKTKQKQGDDSQ
ncbi:GerA spore germination protein [Paenibacillus sp. yr247]|uniref:spore germination protein n=1 Tax=Paenibacillus sp. yr247 TaxID=1761880 RepID=UPI000883714F|nr:spore germination protein [Paenibacillus sp. yr247]SDO79132.1 GerA spore germination protein [Paenibacillus sp. yr247]